MNTRKIAFSSVIIAFGILLPFLFHYTFAPTLNLGSKLLPIHYSSFFAGGFFGPMLGFVVGLITPILSFLISGMPPFPNFIFITFETVVYGLVFGFLYYQKRVNIYFSLITSMILGRFANILSVYFIGNLILGEGYKIMMYIDNLTVGIIGALIQLAIIPIVIKRINLVYGFTFKD